MEASAISEESSSAKQASERTVDLGLTDIVHYEIEENKNIVDSEVCSPAVDKAGEYVDVLQIGTSSLKNDGDTEMSVDTDELGRTSYPSFLPEDAKMTPEQPVSVLIGQTNEVSVIKSMTTEIVKDWAEISEDNEPRNLMTSTDSGAEKINYSPEEPLSIPVHLPENQTCNDEKLFDNQEIDFAAIKPTDRQSELSLNLELSSLIVPSCDENSKPVAIPPEHTQFRQSSPDVSRAEECNLVKDVNKNDLFQDMAIISEQSDHDMCAEERNMECFSPNDRNKMDEEQPKIEEELLNNQTKLEVFSKADDNLHFKKNEPLKETFEEPMEEEPSVGQTEDKVPLKESVDASFGNVNDSDVNGGSHEFEILLDVCKSKEMPVSNNITLELNLHENKQDTKIAEPSLLRLSLLSGEPPKHLVSEPSLSMSLLGGDQSKPMSSETNSAIESLNSRSGLFPPVPCFEEDTRSSWNLDTTKTLVTKEVPKNIDEDAQTSMHVPAREAMLSAKPVDEDSRASVGSQKSVSKRQLSDNESSHQFPAENLFEYQWPSGKGEFYLLQEHISEFLSIKSFKRKYPELGRRSVDVDERRFLMDRGVVSETQCDLGLTAVRSDDVLELMGKDYPEKYQEYLHVLQERERQKISSKHKEYSTALVDKAKINDFLKKAINSAAEYNAHLNQERRDERRTSFDLQTCTLHIPASKIVKLDKEATKVGRYPVALLPGQYQDSYRMYTSEELKYLPLNTVLYGPLKELASIYTQPSSDGSQSDSDDSCASGSCCSSSQGTADGSADSSSGSEQPKSSKNRLELFGETTYKPKDKPNAQCKVCHSTSERNKDGHQEGLVHCSECDNSGHPTCLDLTPEMVAMVKTYPWQCMDCKTCMLCMDPYDEDKMMFCDKCDRGYHTFCVGLKSIPSGRWICQQCGVCASCGSRNPGPEGSKAQWHQEIKSATASGEPMKQLFCLTCVKQKKHR